MSPDVTPYADHLEYLKDQFFRIELYQKLSQTKHSTTENSPSLGRIKNKLELLESRIVERIKVTNLTTGAVRNWESVGAFAKSQSVKRNTVQKRMNVTNGRWNGFKIEYLK